MVHKTHYKAQIAKHIGKIYKHQHKFRSVSAMCEYLNISGKTKQLKEIRDAKRNILLSSYFGHLHKLRTRETLSKEEKLSLVSKHMKELGELRKEKNLTHKEISEATYMIGRGVILEHHVVNYLNGKGNPYLSCAIRLRIAIDNLPSRSKKWSRRRLY